MNKTVRAVYAALLTLLVAAACKQQQENTFSANDLAVTWQMGENNYQGKGGFSSAFVLVNQGTTALPASGWNVYFNFVRFIKPASVTGNVAIRHINGDFYELSPTENFTLAPGDSVEIEFVSSDWAISNSDAPAGLYLVKTDADGKELAPEVISNYTIKPFTPAQAVRSPGDQLQVPSSVLLYEKYALASTLDAEALPPVLPSPVSYQKGKSEIILAGPVNVVAGASLKNEKELMEHLVQDLQQASENNVTRIELRLGDFSLDGKKLSAGSEAYTLDIKRPAIVITGTDAAGVFYGIQTLRAMTLNGRTGKTVKLSEAVIRDSPRFHYRGIHLDVARNFQTKATVLKMLELMSFYKLNKLHFHLSDDEGWRIEIKSLPELTAVGGKRGHDKTGKGMTPSYGSGPSGDHADSHGSGFYTEADFIEILQFARDRHIEIIPKIDMPGHARAAIKAMDARYEKFQQAGKSDEARQYLLRDLADSSVYRSVQQYNDNVISVCQESTYTFIKTVVEDLKAMYRKADVTFNTFHIGADEVPHGVWEKSPACAAQGTPVEELQEYFYKRVSDLLKEQGLNMGGWEEIALKKMKTDKGMSLEANPAFVNANLRPYVWNSVWGWDQEDVGYKLANAGYKVVLGNVTNLYFDLAYEKHPEEPGYYWGAFIDTRKVYEFNPYNIYLDATEDRMGNPLDQEKLKQKVRLTPAGKANILGIQGQLWAENIKGQDVLEYMAFPKLLALAERAWAKEPAWCSMTNEQQRKKSLEQSWSVFANVVGQRELPRLDVFETGVNYRISPPGAKIAEGKLYANAEFPGQIIRYTTDGTEPTASSPEYKEPVAMGDQVVKLKAFNTKGRGSRTVTAVVEPKSRRDL